MFLRMFGEYPGLFVWSLLSLQLITKRQILDSSNLKHFADDNCKNDENGEVRQKDRKRYGKKRNCSLRAISPFPSAFSNTSIPDT